MKIWILTVSSNQYCIRHTSKQSIVDNSVNTNQASETCKNLRITNFERFFGKREGREEGKCFYETQSIRLRGCTVNQDLGSDPRGHRRRDKRKRKPARTCTREDHVSSNRVVTKTANFILQYTF
ncbi:hypothetical protein WN55_06734 [Dufourea novaeangliae]|uniref:Uncharacterized protein n=1 Tax=Dufourea novaeangliae TaxID=178035 RepID=A0A154P307_DUFNO|nr:hypothetical protein WN55_06734 [Dufourea novaeangliae]